MKLWYHKLQLCDFSSESLIRLKAFILLLPSISNCTETLLVLIFHVQYLHVPENLNTLQLSNRIFIEIIVQKTLVLQNVQLIGLGTTERTCSRTSQQRLGRYRGSPSSNRGWTTCTMSRCYSIDDGILWRAARLPTFASWSWSFYFFKYDPNISCELNWQSPYKLF